jgi:hypothetical protein
MLKSVQSNNAESNTENGNNNPGSMSNWNKINAEDLMRLIKRLFPVKTEHSFSKLQKVSIKTTFLFFFLK